jgi:hypothetical protein
VVDDATGNPLPGATVTIISTGDSGTTGASGAVAFDSIYVGEHNLKIDLAGYASLVRTAIISNTESGVNFVANEKEVQIRLFPVNAQLEGTLFYENRYGNLAPAIGATVYIQFARTDLLNTIYEAKVDIAGKYVFNALPATGGYSIRALEYKSDSATYKSFAFTNEGLIAGVKSYIPQKVFSYNLNVNSTILNIIGDFRTHTVDSLGTEVVVFEFSDAVNLEPGESTVTITDPRVAVQKVWSADGKKLSLVLFGGAKWRQNFSVVFDLKSVNNATCREVLPISYVTRGRDLAATGAIGVVVNRVYVTEYTYRDTLGVHLASGFSDSTLNDFNIYWQPINGATGYNIFVKATTGNNRYINVATVTGSALTNYPNYPRYNLYGDYARDLLGFTYNPDGFKPLLKGGQLHIFIQAFNEVSEVPLATAVTQGTIVKVPFTDLPWVQ